MSHDHTPLYHDERLKHGARPGAFQPVTDIHLFYAGGDRGAILDELCRGLSDTPGPFVVHGERGSGKTLLSMVLADRVKRRFNVIRYDHPALSPALLLRHLLIEICPRDADLIGADGNLRSAGYAQQKAAENRLNAAMYAPPPAARPYLLVLDSSAETTPETQALLERLARICHHGRPALQIVSFRRSTDSHRRLPSRRDVADETPADRDDREFRLRRLSMTEVHDYLRHRMLLHDYTRRDLFTADMAAMITQRTHGVFSAIDALVRDALKLCRDEPGGTLSLEHLANASSHARREPIAWSLSLRRHRTAAVALLGAVVVSSVFALIVSL